MLVISYFSLLLVVANSSGERTEELREILDAAKESKRDVDKLRKAQDAAIKEVTSLQQSIENDTLGLEALRNRSERAHSAIVESVEEYGRLVVFMQQCEGEVCGGSMLESNNTEQIRALLKATASRESLLMADQLASAKAEIAELRGYMEDTAIATAVEREQLESELYRLDAEVQKHESEANRLRETDKKKNKERDRLDAEKVVLEKTIVELQRRQAYECEMATQHDEIMLAPGALVITRLYEADRGEVKLRWALAEVIAISEGDGRDPDSLLQLRLFKDKIKSASKYALDSSFVRDFSQPHWIRRDAIAYVDVRLSGAPDPIEHKLAYAPDVLLRGYYNKTAEATSLEQASSSPSSNSEKENKKNKRKNLHRSDHDLLPENKRRSSHKDSSSGVKIAESEKRGILARLERDEARWESRDNSEPHATKTPEPGQQLIWSYEFYNSTGGPELWFRIGTVLSIVENEILLRGTEPPLHYPLNETELDERFNATSFEYAVHRNDIVYVDLSTHESNPKRGKRNDNESSYTLRSAEKKSAARVLRQATGRWLAGFEYRELPACHCPELPPCPNITCPEPIINDTTVKSCLEPPQYEELPPPPPSADVIDFLNHLKRKLQWLVDVQAAGLLSSDEIASQRTKILNDFELLGALPPLSDNHTMR